MKTYSELITLPTFEERYRYLRVGGIVGERTFGGDRWINQALYMNRDLWKSIRAKVIVRDNGKDLGLRDTSPYEKIIVHHIEPITLEDIQTNSPKLYSLDNLISTTMLTHNAIHYGDESLLPKEFVERKPWDTCPWRINDG